MTKTTTSYLYLIAAQFIVGINIVVAKVLLPVMPAYLLLGLRFAIGSIILGVICIYHKENPRVDIHGHKLRRRDWLVIFAQALCAGFLFNMFMLSGLHYTDATTAGIITSTTPAAIAILSFFVLKEKLGWRRLTAIVLAIIGLMVISVGKQTEGISETSIFGDILVLIAVIPEALFTVLAKWHRSDISSNSMSLIASVFNVILFFPLAISSIQYISPDFGWFHFMLLCIYGLCGGALFFIFWYRGLAGTSASVAAIFTAIMPISTTLLAFVFLKEAVSLYEVLGIGLVIGSIVFGSMRFKKLRIKAFLLNG